MQRYVHYNDGLPLIGWAMIAIVELWGELHWCWLLSDGNDESVLREASLDLSYLKEAEGPMVG